MRPGWFDERAPSAWKRLALLPLDAAALLYAGGARLNRASYRRGLRAKRHLACKVVSVGNLVAGGSGKTPLAAWIAAQLRARGHRVVLASRGYGRRGREAVEVVSDGRFLRSSAELAGDEPLLLAAHAPGVPVLVGADRAVVGLRAQSAFGAQVLVLDDGFQHHRLARDVDILAFDGAGLGNGRLLPRGPLREPLSALALAQAVGVVDGPLCAEDEARIAARCSGARRFAARRRATQLRPLVGAPAEPVEGLKGRQVGLLSGIARPASLRRSVEALGAEVVAERHFADHHRYGPRDLRGLDTGPELWVTTEKDAVKILPRWAAGVDLRVLVIELEVEGGAALLDWLEEQLRGRPGGRDVTVPVARPPL